MCRDRERERERERERDREGEVFGLSQSQVGDLLPGLLMSGGLATWPLCWPSGLR